VARYFAEYSAEQLDAEIRKTFDQFDTDKNNFLDRFSSVPHSIFFRNEQRCANLTLFECKFELDRKNDLPTALIH
jgi:hypothetical protein